MLLRSESQTLFFLAHTSASVIKILQFVKNSDDMQARQEHSPIVMLAKQCQGEFKKGGGGGGQ